MFGYRIPEPDQVMLVSGRKSTEENPFKIFRQGKFIVPGFRKARFLSLSQMSAGISEDCTTTQGLGITVTAVVAFRVASDDLSIYAAGLRFLGDQKIDRDGSSAMMRQAQQIFAGHLRSIVGAMTLEDINAQRQMLADQVLDASKTEMGRMGLEVDSFQLTSVGGEQARAYFAAMAAPHTAARQRDAAIAQSNANQLAAEAEQESQRNQAEYQRKTLVLKAEYQGEVDTQNATQQQAGPLADAKAQKAVLEQQTELAIQQAALKAAQLRTDQIKVAEAAAERLKIEAAASAEQTKILAAARAEQTKLQADADAHATRVTAEATAAEGKVTLDRMLIEQLPQLVEAASKTLHGANVTLFNGADGANQILTAALTQGMGVFQTVRSQLNKAAETEEIEGIRQASGL